MKNQDLSEAFAITATVGANAARSRRSVARRKPKGVDRRRTRYKERSVWCILAASFAEAKQMLVEKAEEFVIDLDAVSDEEFAAIRSRQDEFIEGDVLFNFAEILETNAGDSRNINDWLTFKMAFLKVEPKWNNL